jgi:GT2 family glycosyltransferase
MSGSDVDVVIVTRERWAVLERTVSALRGQTVSGFRTVIVCDGTDQDVPPRLRRSVGSFLIQERAGLAAARNRGVSASDGPLVLFLGDDMIPRSDLVERHLERHDVEAGEGVAVLGRIEWHQAVAGRRLERWLAFSGAEFDYLDPSQAAFESFSSDSVSLSRAAFEAVGGFDESLPSGYEDLELGRRLGQDGVRLVYEPRAIARHLHRHDWESIIARFRGHAEGERLMASRFDWFTPRYRERIEAAAAAPAVSPVWISLAQLTPPWPRSVRRGVHQRADRWYVQQLAEPFLAAWDEAGAH